MKPLIFASADEHFADAIKRALKHKKMQTDPALEAYLVALLSRYMLSESLYAPVQTDDLKPLDTFAEMYLSALGPKNKEVMRVVGDRSLYMTGFFAGSLNRKLVDADYFISIGAAAYNHLHSWTTSAVFKTLAKQFAELVDVLGLISTESMTHTKQDILKLYSFYLATGSQTAWEKLFELGVIPVSSAREHN